MDRSGGLLLLLGEIVFVFAGLGWDAGLWWEGTTDHSERSGRARQLVLRRTAFDPSMDKEHGRIHTTWLFKVQRTISFGKVLH